MSDNAAGCLDVGNGTLRDSALRGALVVFMLTAACSGCSSTRVEPRTTPRPVPPAVAKAKVCPTGSQLVPGGAYPLGDTCPRCMPPATYHVASFCIDTMEVSGLEYVDCVRSGRCRFEGPTSLDPHECWNRTAPAPGEAAACLSYDELAGYCAWRGGRVPSEVEWEAAARGTDRRRFPWGNDESLLPSLNTFRMMPMGFFRFDISAFGVHDMASGPFEWTSTPAGPVDSFEEFGTTLSASGPWRWLKGFSYHSDPRYDHSISARNPLLSGARLISGTGGRCVHALLNEDSGG